jgi:kynurenine 3-monooxygenase
MVMFHHEIPYSVAYDRGRIQAGILERLTERVATLAEVDMQRADTEVRAALPPLDSPAVTDAERTPRRA